MTTFHEQMKNAREFEGRTIRDYPSWTLQDYRDFMYCVEKGYLVQDCVASFMINEEWEGDDIYAEEFLEEEEEDEQTRNASGEKWEEKDCPIEDNNDDCSRCGIILTNDDMYSETGKCEDCLEEVEEMTTQQLREKIGAWLSDKTNHEGDLVDFLVDECGVVLKEDDDNECVE
jgi:hypothetical protein